MSTNPDDNDVAAVKEEIMIDLLHFQKLTSFDDAGCHRSRPMHVPAFHIQERFIYIFRKQASTV